MSDQNDVSCPVADTQPSLTEGMWGLFHNVKEQTGKIVNSINSELIRNEDLLIDSITSKVQSLGLVLPEKAESARPVKDEDKNEKKTILISPDVKQSFTDGLQSVERAMTKVSDSVVDSTFKLFGISVEDGEDRTQSRPGDDLESRELALQSDYSTYLADLDPEKNMAFASFKDTFDVKSILHQGEIVLETNSVVKKIFEELVPEQVSETDFLVQIYFPSSTTRNCGFTRSTTKRFPTVFHRYSDHSGSGSLSGGFRREFRGCIDSGRLTDCDSGRISRHGFRIWDRT
eukprot:534806_1